MNQWICSTESWNFEVLSCIGKKPFNISAFSVNSSNISGFSVPKVIIFPLPLKQPFRKILFCLVEEILLFSKITYRQQQVSRQS